MEIITAFTTIFFILGLGYAIQRFRPWDLRTLEKLSDLVVYVLLPVFLFYTAVSSDVKRYLSVAPALIALGFVVPLLGLGLAYLAAKVLQVKSERRPIFQYIVMIANTAFMGIPICQQLFGPVGAIYAMLYDFGTTLIFCTVGIWILGGRRSDGSWRLLFLSPMIWGVLVGFAWTIFGWGFPEWVGKPLLSLSNTALPLALLLCGMQLGQIKIVRGSWFKELISVTALRLFVIPFLVTGAFLAAGNFGLEARVATVQSAMPVGLISAMVAKNFHQDADFAAAAILWSTAGLIVGLPIVGWILSLI